MNFGQAPSKGFPSPMSGRGFYIAYVVEGDLIWVLAVAHSSRKPGVLEEPDVNL